MESQKIFGSSDLKFSDRFINTMFRRMKARINLRGMSQSESMFYLYNELKGLTDEPERLMLRLKNYMEQ